MYAMIENSIIFLIEFIVKSITYYSSSKGKLRLKLRKIIQWPLRTVIYNLCDVMLVHKRPFSFCVHCVHWVLVLERIVSARGAENVSGPPST